MNLPPFQTDKANSNLVFHTNKREKRGGGQHFLGFYFYTAILASPQTM